MLTDLATQKAWPEFSFAALRYFNASGCAMDGSIGEDHDPETHLIPVILQAILGVRPASRCSARIIQLPMAPTCATISMWMTWPTRISRRWKSFSRASRFSAIWERGGDFSVKEIIATAEKVTGKKVPVTFGPRRAGDAIALYANPARASELLGWEARHKDPEAIIQSAWNWFKDHPTGYKKK